MPTNNYVIVRKVEDNYGEYVQYYTKDKGRPEGWCNNPFNADLFGERDQAEERVREIEGVTFEDENLWEEMDWDSGEDTEEMDPPDIGQAVVATVVRDRRMIDYTNVREALGMEPLDSIL